MCGSVCWSVCLFVWDCTRFVHADLHKLVYYLLLDGVCHWVVVIYIGSREVCD